MRENRAAAWIVVAIACLAVLGAGVGWFMAAGATSEPDDASRSPGAPRESRPDPTGSRDTTSAPTPAGTDGVAAQQYRIDRVIFRQGMASVTLVSVESSGGKLRVNLSYQNDSPVEWPLTCPNVEDDRNSSRIVLSDGRIVRPDSTWCATNRPGEAFRVAPGGRFDSWGVFPVQPQAGMSFQLKWYDFPTLDNVRLR